MEIHKKDNENNHINNKSFNSLVELQKLLKSESSLKELFIKTGVETKKNIEQQCTELYEKKMEVLNILYKISTKEMADIQNSNINSNSNDKTTPNPEVILKEYILVKNNYDYLSELNTYIPNLLSYLWDDPKLVANLLINADHNDTKKYLAPLICNNYFENILSSNYIEDPLLYVIYLLLDEEINQIEDIKESTAFLNDTQCSLLLGQLIEKNDVKDFFKIILEDIIENIGTKVFDFDLKQINGKKGRKDSIKVYEKDQKDEKKKKKLNKRLSEYIPSNQQKNPENNIPRKMSMINENEQNDQNKQKDLNNNNKLSKLMKEKSDYEVFFSTYLADISCEKLSKKIQEVENESIKNYYNLIISKANNNDKAYSLEKCIDCIASSSNRESTLITYMQDYFKIKEFIDKLFNNLISNFRIFPYSIKCVCKIIYELVKKKFPNSSEIERDILISKFFFKTLLYPILSKPDINALINNFIISNTTIANTRIIHNILWQLVSFKLFKNDAGGNYTPFNNYFFEIIEKVFNFYDLIIKEKLPPFIMQLINNKISKDEYVFDYFKENPNEVLFHKSVLLNIDEFNALNRNLLKNKDKLFVKKENMSKKIEKNNRLILMALDKINSEDNIKILDNLLLHDKYNIVKKNIIVEGFFSKKKKETIESKTQIIYYFHVSQLLFNDRYEKIFALEQKKPYYHIKELKDLKNNKDLINKNNIIKAKNFLSSILYNYRLLAKSDFDEKNITKTENILNELSLFMKSSNFLTDGNIPSEWYVSALKDCLKKLPDEYRKNDFELLYNELKQELIDSLKLYNFEDMSIFIEKMKYAKRNKIYFNKTKEIYLDIELNNKVRKIIENNDINVYIYYKITDTKKELNIYKETIKEKQLEFLDSFTFKENNEKGRPCKKIHDFIKNFPNLNNKIYSAIKVLSNDKNDIQILQLQKELKIPENLKKFFSLVNESLKAKVKIKDEKELNLINNKIYDYVMEKLFDKIYPKKKKDSQNQDIDYEIFNNTCQVSWIEPQNIIKNNIHYDFELVLPDINKYFELIKTEKSPRKKLLNLNNIFSSVNRLLIFNSGVTKVGVDDQMPVLTYCFIKTIPVRIYTNLKFMELYIGEKKNKGEDNQLAQMLSICDFMTKVNYKSFYNMDEQEFNEKSQGPLTKTYTNSVIK